MVRCVVVVGDEVKVRQQVLRLDLLAVLVLAPQHGLFVLLRGHRHVHKGIIGGPADGTIEIPRVLDERHAKLPHPHAASGHSNMEMEDAPIPDSVAGSGCTAGSEQTTAPKDPCQLVLCIQLLVLKRAFVPP